MSARMDKPLTCSCEEMEAHQTIELLVRGLLADPGNTVITGHRLTLELHLANLESIRTIKNA